jgi:hypothetical protein
VQNFSAEFLEKGHLLYGDGAEKVALKRICCEDGSLMKLSHDHVQ